jgi:hypothetical protein
MEQFTGVSLKTRLFLLVLVAFIPVTLLIVHVAEEQKRIETDAILHKTTLLAQSAAEAENLQIEDSRNLMAAVSETFLLVDGQIDSAVIEALDSVRPEMVNLVRVQGGQRIQTGDIWLIFRGFGFAAQHRNRARGAVSGRTIDNASGIEDYKALKASYLSRNRRYPLCSSSKPIKSFI